MKIADVLLLDFDNEISNTRRTLERLPDTLDPEWAPHTKSMKLGKGSVVYADGCLFSYDESDGALAVIEATPKGYNEKGRFKIAQPSARPRPPRNSSNYWTHPVIANGRLYRRDQESLVCYDIRGK